MTPAWCSWSKRVLPGYEWHSHERTRCPQCFQKLTVVAGRLPKHRLRGAKTA